MIKNNNKSQNKLFAYIFYFILCCYSIFYSCTSHGFENNKTNFCAIKSDFTYSFSKSNELKSNISSINILPHFINSTFASHNIQIYNYNVQHNPVSNNMIKVKKNINYTQKFPKKSRKNEKTQNYFQSYIIDNKNNLILAENESDDNFSAIMKSSEINEQEFIEKSQQKFPNLNDMPEIPIELQ